MDEQKPPPRPRRRPVAVYLTDAERQCIDTARAKAPRGPWMRRAGLFRAGWHGYSGPMFERGDQTAAARVERAQVGDVIHELIRTLDEVGATACALVASDVRPGDDLTRMIVQLCRLVGKHADALPMLRRFDDALELGLSLEAAATRVSAVNGIAGSELAALAASIIEAIGRKDIQHG